LDCFFPCGAFRLTGVLFNRMTPARQGFLVRRTLFRPPEPSSGTCARPHPNPEFDSRVGRALRCGPHPQFGRARTALRAATSDVREGLPSVARSGVRALPDTLTSIRAWYKISRLNLNGRHRTATCSRGKHLSNSTAAVRCPPFRVSGCPAYYPSNFAQLA
jgi:hypothetical protein